MEIAEEVAPHARTCNSARTSSPAVAPKIVNLDYALVATCQALGAVRQAAGRFGQNWPANALNVGHPPFARTLIVQGVPFKLRCRSLGLLSGLSMQIDLSPITFIQWR